MICSEKGEGHTKCDSPRVVKSAITVMESLLSFTHTGIYNEKVKFHLKTVEMLEESSIDWT